MREYLKRKYYLSRTLVSLVAEVEAQKDYSKLQASIRRSGVERHRIKTVNSLRDRYSDEIHKTCHILASGASVLESSRNLDSKRDFIVGFNYAGFLPVPFDVYFIETATTTGVFNEHSRWHEQLYLQMCEVKQPDVFVKCLWARESWDADYINNKYGSNLSVIEDILPSFPIVAKSRVIGKCYKQFIASHARKYFVNGASSSIFAMLFAYRIGFRNIVIHGLDFKGPHFYHSDVATAGSLLKDVRLSTPLVVDTHFHSASMWMAIELPRVLSMLDGQGVAVYSASDSSMFSTYAPVFPM